MGDSLHYFSFGLYIKVPAGSYCHSPLVPSCLLSFFYNRFYHIPCLKSEHLLLPDTVASWEAFFGYSRSLIRASTLALYTQHYQIPLPELCYLPYTQGIQSMRLGEAKASPV